MASLTQTGTVIGTAGYLSPEQAQGSPATPASDRYALAVVAWELLAGVRPFANTNPAAEATAHVWSPVPSLAAKRPGIPPSVDAVFARALAKNPATRFPSNRAFVAALHAAFTQVSAPTTVVTRTAAPPVAVRRRRSGGLLLPLLVLLALGAAGIAAAVIVANRGSSPAAARVVRITVTRAGTTVHRTVTAQPTAPASTTSRTTITTVTTTPSSTTTLTTTSSTPSGASAASQGYAKMQAGDYAGAVPLLEQAAQDLQGSNSLDEAYNDFNLALSLAKTQGCSAQVLQLLDASQAIQGHRGPIDELRAACTAPAKKPKKH
jgi:serine/threonine-protein kinase